MSLNLSAQRDTLGRYSPGFKFKDGVYLSFEDFKANCPSVSLGELRDSEGTPQSDIDISIVWYSVVSDSLMRIPRDSVWGFSSRGQVYVKHQEYFDRLIVIGSLCHLIHREEYLDYSGAYANGYNVMPVRRELKVEFVIEMETGKKIEFTEKNFEDILSKEPTLLFSYQGLSKKEQKQSIYRHLHAYNELRPTYFSISRCR